MRMRTCILLMIILKQVLKVLDSAAPLKTYQRRRNHRNWIQGGQFPDKITQFSPVQLLV